MAAVIILGSVLTVTGFIVGWVLADNKLFWDRQNYMEKINRKF